MLYIKETKNLFFGQKHNLNWMKETKMKNPIETHFIFTNSYTFLSSQTEKKVEALTLTNPGSQPCAQKVEDK